MGYRTSVLRIWIDKHRSDFIRSAGEGWSSSWDASLFEVVKRAKPKHSNAPGTFTEEVMMQRSEEEV